MNFIDIHTHILPGVDDGAQDLEQSVRMLMMAQQQGTEAMILTPHNKPEQINAPPDKLRKRLAKLQKITQELDIPIQLYAGMEIDYRDGVAALLETGELLTLADSQYVLVEFHPQREFSYMRNAIYELTSYGFTPILAHVERYEFVMAQKERLAYFLEHGALLQINANSITTQKVPSTKKMLKYLLKEHMIHFVASDAHNEKERNPQLINCARYLEKKVGKHYTQSLLYDHAQMILEHESLY
ncbi:MAG: hypothetical protein LBM69_08385 [Lachnospiraceae bacterium]|jgi:protein-tyrosine phosphatase|nr:hypothetical protein [Lachnospiraceae bacterium]